MFDPDTLRKRSAEAAERIERDRRLEDDRLRREAEARREAADRVRQQEADRALWRKQARRLAQEWLGRIVQAAARGEPSLCAPVPAEVMAFLGEELAALGFACTQAPVSAAADPSPQLRVEWQAIEPSAVRMAELSVVPFWLLSGGGRGLMQQLAACAESDAEAGRHQSTFELLPLSVAPARWAQDTVTKFMHRGQPIGVCPFPPKLMVQVMELCGFRARLAVGMVPLTLTIAW